MKNVEIQIIASDNATRVINTLKNAVRKSPTGVSMISIRNYTNSYNEISNSRINIGASYENAKQKDINFLKALDITTLENRKSDVVTLEMARIELIKSFETPDKNRSNGQIDAYTHIVSGLKVHNETSRVYIYGLRVAKEVIVKGEYPVVNSKPLTIAKNELRKLLKTNEFVNFAIDMTESIRANGEELTF
jgi:hypothetical protein